MFRYYIYFKYIIFQNNSIGVIGWKEIHKDIKVISENDDSEIISFNLDNKPESYNDGKYLEFRVFFNGLKNIYVATDKDTLYVKGINRANQTELFTVLSVVLKQIDFTKYNLPSDCAFYKDVDEIKIMTHSEYSNKIE